MKEPFIEAVGLKSPMTSANVYKLFKVPLAFLLIASLLGVLLRYQQVMPLGGIVYNYLLHAHSHVMFLGWVFNVLILALTVEFAEVRGFRVLFWVLQFCVTGMLISFPLQGYGTFSIIFSSAHTFCAFVFIILFFRATSHGSSIALSLARTALLFFVLSSFGPFGLGYLKSNGLEHSNLYRLAIYFYLHFQYNGFFFFGILSLFVRLIEDRLQPGDLNRIRHACYVLIVACVPAYILSTLWSRPSLVFNGIGFLTAAAQLAALYMLHHSIKKFMAKSNLSSAGRMLYSLSFAALTTKFILQLLSAHPAAALLADEYRPIVIAYLHLVLVGFTSFFLFGWMIQKNIIPVTVRTSAGLLAGAFILSETLLAVLPWCENYVSDTTIPLLKAILLLSVLMAASIGSMVAKAYQSGNQTL